MVTIHKHKDEYDGFEYINPTEVFEYEGYEEFTEKG